MDPQIEAMIKEAAEAEFRCVHCEAIKCNCDTEPGEPDGF